MTYYAGFDVSMKSTSIAIVDEKGKICFESVCETEPEAIITAITSSGFVLEKAGIESGSISFWLMEELKKSGLTVICIESRQMAALISLKVNKTDRNDARLIANAMRCNLYKEVFHKSKTSIDVGIQMGARRVLIDTRTKLKNCVRGFLKAYGIRLGSVSHEPFPEVVRGAIRQCEQEVKDAMEGLLRSFEEVCRNIQMSEKALEKMCKEDPVVLLLQSIPGVGPVTAITYKAVIDDPYRFEKVRDVGAYLGLTPKQYSSGETVKQGRISKCGSQELRNLLVECGHVLLTRTNGWSKLKAWGLKIMKRSGIKKAATAVARKLAIIMLRMWQTGSLFVWGDKKEPEQREMNEAMRKSTEAIAVA